MPDHGHEEITIQDTIFRVPLRYAPGLTMGEPEANALNQLLHEKLRNNFAPKVLKGLEEGTSVPDLQTQLDAFAQTYTLGRRRGGRTVNGPTRADPAMTLAMNLARDLVRKQIKAKGLDTAQWPAERVSRAAQQLLDQQGANGALLQSARSQLDAAAAAAAAEVSTILDSTAPTPAFGQ